MKKFFNWLIVLGAVVGAVYGVGLIVPRTQISGSKTNLQTKPDQLYALVSDLSTWPQWNPDVAAVNQRPEKNGNPIWRVTTRAGESYELEVTKSEEPANWTGTYEIGGTRTTLRFDFNWHGSGGRVRVTKNLDMRDPWMRARWFFWSREEASPVALLNALSEHLGEAAAAQDG